MIDSIPESIPQQPIAPQDALGTNGQQMASGFQMEGVRMHEALHLAGSPSNEPLESRVDLADGGRKVNLHVRRKCTTRVRRLFVMFHRPLRPRSTVATGQMAL
jgi:hypothetical protein